MVPPSSAAITGGSPASAARPTGASSGGSSRGSAEPSIWRTTWSGPPAEGSIDQVASSVRIEPCSRPSMATSVTELIGAPGTCPDQASAPPRSVSRRSSSARTTTPPVRATSRASAASAARLTVTVCAWTVSGRASAALARPAGVETASSNAGTGRSCAEMLTIARKAMAIPAAARARRVPFEVTASANRKIRARRGLAAWRQP